jgi:hypothetical protein
MSVGVRIEEGMSAIESMPSESPKIKSARVSMRGRGLR